MLKLGTFLQKGKKKYILIGWNIIAGGHVLEYKLIRYYENCHSTIQFIKYVSDDAINSFKIIPTPH